MKSEFSTNAISEISEIITVCNFLIKTSAGYWHTKGNLAAKLQHFTFAVL